MMLNTRLMMLSEGGKNHRNKKLWVKDFKTLSHLADFHFNSSLSVKSSVNKPLFHNQIKQ